MIRELPVRIKPYEEKISYSILLSRVVATDVYGDAVASHPNQLELEDLIKKQLQTKMLALFYGDLVKPIEKLIRFASPQVITLGEILEIKEQINKATEGFIDL